MSAENGGDSALFAVPAPVNGEHAQQNGLSNGHVSSSSSSKHRSSSSSGHKSSSKDKHRSSSSSSSSKHRSSSSSSKHHHSSSSSSKHSSSSKDRPSSSSSHKSSSRDKERTHSSSGSSSKHGDNHKKEHSSSSSAVKPEDGSVLPSSGNGSSKEHKSSSSSSRDKDKHRSSSSSHKSGSSSSKHKHSSSSSKHHSSSKDGKHRSSSKDKDRSSKHSSSSKDGKHRSSKDAGQPAAVEQSQQLSTIHEEHAAAVVPMVTDVIDTASLSVANVSAHGAIKQESQSYNNHDMSQASSCDYSFSQFRADESDFKIKAETSSSEQNGYGHTNGHHNLRSDDDEDEDTPISKRVKTVKHEPSDSEEDAPIVARKIKTEKVKKAKKKKHQSDDEDDYENAPITKKIKKEKKPVVSNYTAVESPSPVKKGGRAKKEEQPEEVWKWWEEEKRSDGVKWNFLEHRGPVFAPPYEPLPANVHFFYDGKQMKLSQDAEEIASFYAKMLNHDFTSKKTFNDNFFADWRKEMTSKERERITNLKLCNFQPMFEHFQAISERNKNRTKEEKAELKAQNEALVAEYGFCTIDGHKEKIGNFRIEPPGLFRGRGEHPKMGKVKRRVMPEDILINCSRDSCVPQAPAGHRWREVKHDNAVTWLASWTENVQGQVKYVMLNPSSKLKGEKDWQKYETARRLHKHIDRIRDTYRDEWKSKEMRIRQRGVALYFIDKLALRAGNEKDDDQADTVGCCSLRYEHIQLHRQMGDRENVVVFDFLGKDSIRYYNEVEVEKRVFKNLELFRENKKEGDDLFDRLNTVVMNEHLRDLMDGLTAKVFRTYNASWTLQCQLNELTDGDASLPEKLLAYNRANRAVAVLCNHQRAVPKSHEKSMENLKEKIRAKRDQLDDLRVDVKDAVKAAKHGSMREKIIADKKKKQLERAEEQLKKMELQETDRDENKTIALGTSKLNYLDPRISVAWCKKHNVPIDKIYNKTQRDKFRWAIDMATEEYQF